MNCREAESRLYADQPADPTAGPDAAAPAFSEHLATCSRCRETHGRLREALDAWRTETAVVAVPDAEREWHAVRRRIRHDGATARPARRYLPWLSLPLGLGAAAALAFLALPRPAPPAVARVEFVEVPGGRASTMVVVDEQSGWLIVQASDAPAVSD